MSGPNQHHIPQFLQRSFGVKPKGKKPKEIWVYRWGEKPALDLISKTGSEISFYSPPAAEGEENLDSKITDAENAISKSYHAIRVLPVGAPVEAKAAADLVTHLAPRAAHLRLSVAAGFLRLAHAARELFTDPANLEQLLGLQEDEPTDRFRQKLDKGLGEAKAQIEAAGLPGPLLERVAFYVAKESFDTTVEETIPLLGSVLGGMAMGSSDMIRDGHNCALNDIAGSPNVRRDTLATFEWRIEPAPADGAILPDCVALAFGPDEPALPLMFVGRDLHAVVLPLTKSRLLVGRRSDAPRIALADFNRDAAACCHDFFLTDTNSPALVRLAELIGTRSSAYFADATRDAIDAVLPARQAMRSRTEQEFAPGHLPTESDLDFTFDIRLADFGDDDFAQRLGDAVAPVVRSLGRWLPMSRLDGIEFAFDFPAALRSMDRGRSDFAPVEAIHSGEVGCVGRMVSVLRDDMIKGRILFNANVAGCLLSEEQKDLEAALTLMIHQLTLVALIELTERALPGAFNAIQDDLRGALFSQARDALTGYVAARMSAGFGNMTDLEEYHRTSLIEALEAFRADVAKERIAYRYHANLDRLLKIAFPAAKRILNAAADLLGLCAGADRPIFDNAGRLNDALHHANLVSWLPSFARDLGRFYARLGAWTSIEEFLVFSRHVERLFWSVGLFPWQSPQGDRLEVPLFTDAQALLSGLSEATR